MNWFDGFNKILDYIEKQLDGEIDYEKIADILGYSSYHTQRLFMMIAGLSLSDYIRFRRLSKAAEDLGNGEKVLDVAIKYGYSTSNSFNRAFKAMHNISPRDARKQGAIIKAFPPLTFTFTVTGAEEMEYRIETYDAFRVVGKSITTTMRDGICYQEVPTMWQNLMIDGGPGEILALMDKPPFGLIGVSDYKPDMPDSQFDYFIAVSSSKEVPNNMKSIEIPACTWAIFTCKSDQAKNIQKVQERMVMEWLPSSGYEFGNAPDIELYDKEGNVELWLPVRKK